MQRPRYSLRAALALLISLLVAPPASLAAGYDVSYLWSRQLSGVENYRSKVGAVLGPEVARDLRVVVKGSLYGLIYVRNGSARGAENVAARHSRLLRAKGLERAAPVRSLNWTYVNHAAAPKIARAPEPTPRPAAPAATATVPVAETTPRPAPAAPQPVAVRESGASVRTAVERRSSRNDIELAVEEYVKDLRRRGAIARDERTAWSVYDFTTGEKLVDINEDVQFQAASLVKPFFAMAYFHKVKTGELRYTGTARRHMERMIQRSNNGSTNWVMRQVGGPRAVQEILSRNYGGIFDDTRIVEYIPAGGKTYRNKASVHDYSRFLYALWNDAIPGADEIKRLMALPGKDRIYDGAPSIPKGTTVYNKTGSTARLCGDMGILVVRGSDGKSYPYTIVGVIEKGSRASNYTTWIRSRGDVIRGVSNLVYERLSEHHKLRS